MSQLLWFGMLVAIGYVFKHVLRANGPKVYQKLQKVTWLLLLFLILLQFWLNGFMVVSHRVGWRSILSFSCCRDFSSKTGYNNRFGVFSTFSVCG